MKVCDIVNVLRILNKINNRWQGNRINTGIFTLVVATRRLGEMSNVDKLKITN